VRCGVKALGEILQQFISQFPAKEKDPRSSNASYTLEAVST